MQRFLTLVRQRPALSYSAGNILNTLMMVLLLPALMRLDEAAGGLAAKGMLAAQLAAVLATYSFPVVTPRSLRSHTPCDSQRLLRGILLCQCALLVCAGMGLWSVVPHDRDSLIHATAGLVISFSAVLQWQWFHIGRDSLLPQALLLLGSRGLLLALEGLALTGTLPAFMDAPRLSALLAALVLLPTWPTWREISRSIGPGPSSSSAGRLMLDELRHGWDLFLASLLSATYTLGPASLVATHQPGGLVAIQQFDRLRSSMANLTGMLLSTVYPLLLGQGRSALNARFGRTQRWVVLPALLAALALLVAFPWLPEDTPTLLQRLHLSGPALVIALACALAASASNVIALTFLHPLSNDRRYRLVIVGGAMGFALIAGLGLAIAPERLTTTSMAAAGLAELFILTGLWLAARQVLRQDHAG